MNNFKYFRSLVYLTCYLSVSSCNHTEKPSNRQQKPSTTAEWTVMVFINGDNNLEQAAVTDFGEMARVGSTEQVNIIAQMDLIGVYYNIGWSDTRRFRITKDMDPTKDASASMKIGEANMGDPHVLSDFVSWSMRIFPAKKYALVIWDHGQGYRLYFANHKIREDAKTVINSFNRKASNKADSITTPSNAQNENIRIMVGDQFRSVSDNSFKACSNDETSNDELFNREIQDGLAQTLGGKKLDVLGFDACLMGMVETGYAMRNITNNFVASEELEPNAGWNYNDWLQKLENNPSTDGRSLSSLLVDSYADTYGKFSAQTMTAVDLSNFADITNKISKLANSLKARLPTELESIKLARQDCPMYAPNPFQDQPAKDYFFHIDFVKFCDQLVQRTKDPELTSEAYDAKKAILNTVIRNYHGTLRGENYGSNGMAIYFPISNSQYKSDIYERGGYQKENTYFPVEFVQKEKWADFLQAYLKLVP